MSIRCTPMLSRSIAIALLAAAGAAHAQPGASSTAPMPFNRRTAGWLVSDTNTKKVYLVRDLTGDGTFQQPGEISVFFDGAANLSGMPTNATDSVFSIYQAADGTVYIGNGASKTVYALRDSNLDGNAQGAGEARVFYSDAALLGGNASGFSLPTPNGLTGDATSIYVANAGTSTAIQDGLFRLRDLDHDGNANGMGEATLFCDSTTLFGITSSPFDCTQAGGALYFADLRGASADVIYRASDANGDGSIGTTEFNVFLNDGDFGAPAGFACKTDGVSIYTAENTGSVSPQTVYKLTDLNASGNIDSAAEAVLAWSEANLPAGEIMSNSFGMDVAPHAMLILSNGTNANELILARDLNNNGVFTDAGETTIGVRATISGVFPTTPRAVSAYGWPCPADYNMTGGVNVQDIFDFLTGWFGGAAAADFNGVGGVTVQDIFDFLGAWFAGCS